MANPNYFFKLNNLSISFSGAIEFDAVNDISFGLESGKNLAIVGESGSGKSLVALSVIGLAPKKAIIKGNISINDKKLAFEQNSQNDWASLRGNEIAMVFQEPMSALNPVQCVGNQIQECILQHQKISKKAAKKQSLIWIEKVKIQNPKKIYNRFPHQLSGGQKQRIMIAMAMCNYPKLLIADEPTTALDATVQQDIVFLMKNLQKETKTAIIFITHDLGLASIIADDIMVLKQGKCIEIGNVNSILHNPKQPYTRALLSCKPNINNKGKYLPTISDFVIGDFQQKEIPIISNIERTDLLKIEDLKIWYKEGNNLFGKSDLYFKAVNGVNFSLKKGETLGLVGESGCGKSSIGKALIGLAPIHSGVISYLDQVCNLTTKSDLDSIRTKIQLIFQDPFSSLNPRHTIGEIITEPYKINKTKKSNELKSAGLHLLDLVQLPKESFMKYPHQFSGGQRQRIGIARALALNPKVLVCDESVSALDVSIQAQILNLLKELQYEMGLSYLFISHDLSVVHYMADEIMVMKDGVIVEHNNADEIIKNPKNLYTKALIHALPTINF